jgi:hypothetical protein
MCVHLPGVFVMVFINCMNWLFLFMNASTIKINTTVTYPSFAGDLSLENYCNYV